jgi:hypothetical protein
MTETNHLSPDDSPRVGRVGDDGLNHHVLGVDSEKVGPIDQTVEGPDDKLEVGPHCGALRHVSR